MRLGSVSSLHARRQLKFSNYFYFTSTRFFLGSRSARLSGNQVERKLHALLMLLRTKMPSDDLLNYNIVQLHEYIKSGNYKPRASRRGKIHSVTTWLVMGWCNYLSSLNLRL